MKKVLFPLTALSVLMAGCAGKVTTNSSTPTNAASPATASTSKAKEKKAPATNPVPTDWIRMYDDAKGYEFMVPQGTQHQTQTVDAVDIYMASVPAPYELGVMVVTFKDKTLTKEDLLKRAESIL